MTNIADKIARWNELCDNIYVPTPYEAPLVVALREAADECEIAHQQFVQSVLHTEDLRGQIARLEEALRWYAEGRHMDYSFGHPSGAYLKVEPGTRAQQVLDDVAYDKYMAASQALGQDE